MGDLGVLRDMGVGLAWLVLAVGLGFVLAVVFDVLLLQRRRVPAFVIPAAVGCAAAGGALTGLLERLSWDPSDVEVMRIVALTTSAARLLAFFAVGPVAMTLLLATAYCGVRGRPLQKLPAALAGIGCLATCAVVVAGGYAEGDATFANVRALVYALFGVLVVVSMLSAGRTESNGPEAGATAALSFPLIVAAGESGRRGLVELMIVMRGFSMHPPERRGEAIARYYEAVAGEIVWSQLALAISCLVGVVALGASLVALRSERGDPARTSGMAAGVVWLAVAAAVFTVGDLGPERLLELAVASP